LASPILSNLTSPRLASSSAAYSWEKLSKSLTVAKPEKAERELLEKLDSSIGSFELVTAQETAELRLRITWFELQFPDEGRYEQVLEGGDEEAHDEEE
jgi:hypothetical protein